MCATTVSEGTAASKVAELLAESAALSGDEARREAEVLLSHCLRKSRSFLYAFPEAEVAGVQARRYRELLAERGRGTPLAYLLGEREFWSLNLRVNASVLIPRPDTERLVELALQQSLPEGARVLDLGTGSGAIALALASERRHWQLSAVDASAEALTVARENGLRLGLSVRWLLGDWFQPLGTERFAMLLSNPPYIDEDDPHLQQGDLRFEPRRALVAAQRGLAAIRHLVAAAPSHLEPGGVLLLEHGNQQGAAVRDALRERGFAGVQSWTDLAGCERVSGGCWRQGAAAPC